MATSQISEHPLFAGLKELIVFFPNPQDKHDFEKCRWRKKDLTRCRKWRKGVEREARSLWSEIEKKKDCQDATTFFPMVESLLRVTYCDTHLYKIMKPFEEWKGRHSACASLVVAPADTSQSGSQESNKALKDDPDEASEPEIPETPETGMFDPSFSNDASPFPTPLTEPDSIRTPIKLPASILDRSIPDTQPDTFDHVSVSTTDRDKSAVNAVTKDISTLSLGSTLPTPNNSSAGGKPAIAESISGDDNASFNGMSEELSIIINERSVVDQPTDVVSTWEGKAPKFEDDPLGNEIAYEGIGIAKLSRKGTLHYASPIIEALRTPPTPNQRKHGIVYVLRHTEYKGVFKVGWSEKSAIERQHQPKNCYGKNTEIIYESSEPFAGAYKAEILAHKFLGKFKLDVPKCEICGKRHREWFEGEETVIRGTLEAMEDFIQMPAYELKPGQEDNGEMMLSQEAEKRVKSMCNISIEGLRGPTIRQKEPLSVQEEVLEESIGVNTQTTTQAAAPQVTAVIPMQTTEVDSSQKSETSLAGKIGRLVGNAGAQLGKSKRKVKDTFQNMRSRESTPDPDGFQQAPKDAGAFENFSTSILWALKGGKPESLKENGSLWDSLAQKKKRFEEDFAKGRQEGQTRS